MNRQKVFTLKLNPEDNVIITLSNAVAGEDDQEHKLIIRDHIPAGHKIATERIEKGDFIRKYGQIIGIAGRDIDPGEHVHTHNMEMGDFKFALIV